MKYDQGTVQAAIEGDEDAFGVLAAFHRRELHLHCYRMLGSFHAAEDCVQEAMLRAWRKRETFEGWSTYRAWLYRIATNTCLELIRREPRKAPEANDSGGRVPPYSEMPWLQPYPDALLDELVSFEEGPEEAAVARETIALAYLAAIQLLPPTQRAVLILRMSSTFRRRRRLRCSRRPSQRSTARCSGLGPLWRGTEARLKERTRRPPRKDPRFSVISKPTIGWTPRWSSTCFETTPA